MSEKIDKKTCEKRKTKKGDKIWFSSPVKKGKKHVRNKLLERNALFVENGFRKSREKKNAVYKKRQAAH